MGKGEVVPRLTPRQAAILSAFTGYLCGPFEDFHEYVEELMGRPVYTHEMGDKEMAAWIKEASRKDYLNLVCVRNSDPIETC